MKPPYIIAEMGASHGGKLQTALHIIKAAKDAGADAVKLQTWNPDRMVVTTYTIQDGPWKGWDLTALYRESHTPWSWHAELFEYGRELGIDIFSTPFDVDALEFLESLNCPMYKIASCEIVDTELIQRVAAKGKPIIISTGGATAQEIGNAFNAALEQTQRGYITLLKCTAAYPANCEDANLRTLWDMSRSFNCQIGLSDHSQGIAVPVAAAVMGATMIEKHIRLDDGIWNADEGFAATPLEFKGMVDTIRMACAAVGEIHYGPTEGEKSTLKLRRSLYYTRDMLPGDVIKPEDLVSARPALGCPPGRAHLLVGQAMRVARFRGDPASELDVPQ